MFVAKLLLHDLADTTEAEQRGIELHNHIEFVMLHQELGDGLNLIGRATMER